MPTAICIDAATRAAGASPFILGTRACITFYAASKSTGDGLKREIYITCSRDDVVVSFVWKMCVEA